jgi:diguanylate cyclase (GGDEF)-like protein
MEIRSLLRTMREKWWLIIPTFLMVVGSAVVWTISQPKVYEADSQLFVEPITAGASKDFLDVYSLIARQSELSETYAQIATSPPVRRAAIEALDLNFQQQNDVAPDSRLIPGTTLLSVSARSTDPDLARDYTNALVTALIKYVDDLDTPFGLKQVYPAGTPGRPVSPNVPLNVGLGLMVGAALSIGIALVAELLKARRPTHARMEMLDEETSAYSAPYFRLRLRQEVSRVKRSGTNLAVAVMNVNHRGLLDGHTTRLRSDALRQLAGLIDAHLRTEDMSARLNADVFALLFPDTDEAAAMGMIDALRSRMSLPALGVGADGEPIRVHAAAGVVGYHGEVLTDEELIARALRALQDAETVPIGKTQSFSALSSHSGA